MLSHAFLPRMWCVHRHERTRTDHLRRRYRRMQHTRGSERNASDVIGRQQRPFVPLGQLSLPRNLLSIRGLGIGKQIAAHLIVDGGKVGLPEGEILLGWRGVEECKVMEECAHRRRPQIDRFLRLR